LRTEKSAAGASITDRSSDEKNEVLIDRVETMICDVYNIPVSRKTATGTDGPNTAMKQQNRDGSTPPDHNISGGSSTQKTKHFQRYLKNTQETNSKSTSTSHSIA